MKSFLSNAVLVASTVMAQYNNANGIQYGAIGETAAAESCTVITSTIRVTRTLALDDCCGYMATQAYSTLGPASTGGGFLVVPVNGTGPTASSGGSSSSKINGTIPSGEASGCVGPSTLNADCSNTQGCCGGFSCDSTTLRCIPDDDDGVAPPSNSSIPTPANGGDNDDGCMGPRTLGADCSGGDQGCCGGFSCDSTTLKCIPNDDDDDASSAPTSSASAAPCPSTLGADCSGGDQGCCGGFSCDSTTLTCTPDDDDSSSDPSSSDSSPPCPSTLGADCSGGDQGCCGGFSCDSTTLRCISDD